MGFMLCSFHEGLNPIDCMNTFVITKWARTSFEVLQCITLPSLLYNFSMQQQQLCRNTSNCAL